MPDGTVCKVELRLTDKRRITVQITDAPDVLFSYFSVTIQVFKKG